MRADGHHGVMLVREDQHQCRADATVVLCEIIVHQLTLGKQSPYDGVVIEIGQAHHFLSANSLQKTRLVMTLF